MVSWTGVFMRPYYLRLNANGYYVVSFTNKETGKRTNYKSTHSKNYDEALQLAMTWYTSGAPAKQKRKPDYDSAFDFENLLNRLTFDEAKTLYEKLCSKFRFEGTPVQTVAPTPVVESEPVKAAPVEEPAPKKKVIVIRKKKI